MSIDGKRHREPSVKLVGVSQASRSGDVQDKTPAEMEAERDSLLKQMDLQNSHLRQHRTELASIKNDIRGRGHLPQHEYREHLVRQTYLIAEIARLENSVAMLRANVRDIQTDLDRRKAESGTKKKVDKDEDLVAIRRLLERVVNLLEAVVDRFEQQRGNG